MGDVPHWYALFVAAKWLGMDPSVLEQRPKIVMLRALAARDAEIRAENARQDRAL